MRVLAKGGVVLLVLAATLVGIEAAGRADRLEVGALPMALVVIAAFRLLGPRAEHAAWAVFLLLLGLTYVNPQSDALVRELVAFAVCAGLAILGLTTSPWFLAAGFVAHIGWDFLPRELPSHLVGLPVACLLFDGLVAANIAWNAKTGRWISPPRPVPA